MENIQGPVQRRVGNRYGADPEGRKEGEVLREQDQDHHPEPEHRRRIAEQGEDGDDVARHAVRPHRGDHAEQGADADRQHQRRDDQHHGHRQVAQQEREDRLVVVVRVAEIPGQHLPQVGQQLHVDRLVEPVGGADLRRDCGVPSAGFRHEHVDHVAGSGLYQQKIEDDDGEDEEHAVDDALDDRYRHRSVSLRIELPGGVAPACPVTVEARVARTDGTHRAGRGGHRAARYSPHPCLPLKARKLFLRHLPVHLAPELAVSIRREVEILVIEPEVG